MACFESGTVVTVPPREGITLAHVRGATLRVTRGTLWLTEENNRNDVVLRAGDNWLVESNGDTVVEAQNDVTFCVVGRNAASLKLPPRAKLQPGLLTRLAILVARFATPPRQLPYF